MSENEFPTQEQVERRTDQIIEGLGYPAIPALPGIVFRRLTLAERGAASRAFSRAIKNGINDGDLFAESLLSTELRRACLRVGLDYDQLMAAEEAYQRRIFDSAPTDLRDMEPRLSAEELAVMPTEAQEVYEERFRERGSRVVDFFASLFTPEEKVVRAQIEQVKQFKTELQLQTYEHHARIEQRMVELLAGARREDDPDQPYFSSLEELYELADTDNTTWLLVSAKWAEFKAGRWPGFTRRSSFTP